MQPDIARAHAETLTEWSMLYERDGHDQGVSGATEIAFLLQRAALQIRMIVGDAPADTKRYGDGEALAEPSLETEVRAD